MARLTLWGFYQYDNTLFDGIVLPDGMKKDELVNTIMKDSGELYPYHQVPEMLKHNITFWFSRRLFDFDRMYQALRVDYSPIENYDRIENITRDLENSGADKASTTLGSSTTSKHTGTDTDTTQGGGTNEKSVSAYNDSDYVNREKDTQNHNATNSQNYDSTVTNSRSGTDTTQTEYGLKRKEIEEIRVHGNIGVTTSQQMIEAELALRINSDIYRIIRMEFEKEFLVQVY